MLKLYFGNAFTTLSTILILGFIVLFSFMVARRSAIQHWKVYVIVLFFMGLALSVMGGMKDNMGSSAAVISSSSWVMIALCLLGGAAMVTGIVMFFLKKPFASMVGAYLLSGIIIVKLVMTEVTRILQYIRT